MENGFTQELLNWISENPGWAGLLIFLVAWIESLVVVGIVLPGIFILFGIGAMIGLGALEFYPVWLAATLGAFLGAVHAATDGDAGDRLAPRFQNGEMRRLHGEHIFLLPLRPNDFGLSATLRRRADALASRREIVERADAAYERWSRKQGDPRVARWFRTADEVTSDA